MIKILQIIILIISSSLFMSSSCDIGSEGCTDKTACNYDDTAAIDDGSCWISNEGCSCEDPPGSKVDCLGFCDKDNNNNPPDDDLDGICNVDVIGGCIDSLMCNFDQSATHNNDSCAEDLTDFGGLPNGNDCNNDCDGTAVVDECDLCVGGKTNYGKCWQIEIKSITKFKLQNGMFMGSDTNSIIIGASKYALDGYNGAISDNENTDCISNYNDFPEPPGSVFGNDRNFIRFFIPHGGEDEFDEWGSQFDLNIDPYFDRDIRANDYQALFTNGKGMNWFAVIEPTLSDTLIIDENGTVSTYIPMMDSIRFQITHLEGIQCSDIKIYFDREKGAIDGGVEVENLQLGIGVDSDEDINVTIKVSNICIQEFEELCPNDY